MPLPPSNRVGLYLLINVAFLLLVGIAYGVSGFPNPRFLHLVLLFALCSSPIIDMDGFNGRYALLGLYMLVYFVSYGVGDLSDLLRPYDLSSDMQFPHAGEALSKTEAVILLSGVMLVLGYRTAVRLWGKPRVARSPRDWSKPAILIVGAFLWAIGTFATYRWDVVIMKDTTNEAVRKGLESLSNAEATAYVLGQMMQPVGILLLVYAMKVFRSAYLLPIVIAVCVVQLFIGFVADIKGLAILGGLLVIIASVLIDNRLPRAWLAAAAVFIVFLFPIYQTYRTVIHGERGISRTAVIENFSTVLQLTLAAENKVNSGRDRAKTFFERGSLKGTTEIIVEKTGNGVEFQRGHTLEPVLTAFVPKLVWSGKTDLKVGQMVNKEFHMTDSDDIFISPSNLGDLYWNFGWPGALCGMGIIGVLCGWVGARFNVADGRTVTRILVIVVTMKYLIAGFEGVIAAGYVTWLRSLAAIGVLHLAFARVPVVSRLSQPQTAIPGRLEAATPAPLGTRRPFPNLLT